MNTVTSKIRFLLLAILAPILFALNASGTQPMNVLFIVIDDLRPELGAYGKDEMVTPNIDRFADMSLKFDRAYCQYPVCNPSRASFMTGKRPDELGILSNRTPLREKWPDMVTLPQLFKQNGYYTAGLGKLFHQGLDENGNTTLFRDDKSFDHFYSSHRSTPEIGKQGEGRKLGDGSIRWAYWLAAEGGDEAQPDGMLAAEAVSILKEHHEKPFFLGVGFHKPHDPFIAPKEYFEYYPLEDVELPREPEDRVPLLEHSLPSNSWNFDMFTDQDRREFKRAYHACTTFTDAQVGKIFAEMDRFDLWKNTIVVMIGDHGYHLGEHNWWNKVTVFELGARGPFMMWVPGAGGMGQNTSAIVEFLDLYPTLAELCGIKVPHQQSGKSIRPVLEDPNVEWDYPAYTQVTRPKIDMGYSVRYGKWRFIQWGESGQGGYELYDHSSDEIEYYNLAGCPDHQDVKASMHSLLKQGYPNIK